MKTISKLIGAVIAIMTCTACTNVDNSVTTILGNEGGNSFSINRLGGYVEIPVEIEGTWHASINGNVEKGHTWCDLAQRRGNGPGKLVVNVDYMNPLKPEPSREARISIRGDRKTHVVHLVQYIGLEKGEITSTNGTDTPDPDLWHNKGIGRGLDPLSGEMSSNFVLNIKNVIELSQLDDYSTLFAEQDIPEMNVEVQVNDTLENNLDSLGVHCIINVKYAKFKLGLEVDYNNSGQQVEHMTTYTGSQDLKYMEANTSTADIESILENAWDDSANDWVEGDTLAAKVVSTSFKTKWAKVMKNKDDETKFHAAIDDILKNYGPAFVDGATLGGSIFTAIQYDSLSVDNDFKVDGRLTAAVALAVIQISGDVNVTYAQKGQEIWQSSHYLCSVTGGDQTSYSSLLEQLNSMQPNSDALRTAAQTWMSSIRSSHDTTNNTAVINIKYTGIWNLFPSDIADAIKQYIIQYYDGQQLCIDLEDMGVASTTKTQ